MGLVSDGEIIDALAVVIGILSGRGKSDTDVVAAAGRCCDHIRIEAATIKHIDDRRRLSAAAEIPVIEMPPVPKI